ncbi:MAG: class A beta-lactamase [Pseudomonadota bacterium]|nr:class A beta-lactamase [Pseudomonadota bacterium]
MHDFSTTSFAPPDRNRNPHPPFALARCRWPALSRGGRSEGDRGVGQARRTEARHAGRPGEAVLAKKITIREADLRPHSPVTEKRVGTSISTRALCEMTLRTSDNAAANAVLKALGGPAEVTGFLRQIGDETTRLDRYEPELNEAKPGDPSDTTTPQAMAGTLRRLLLQDALGPQSREQLEDWMAANAVAGGLLRSRLPAGWQIADRSGAGGHGTRGVIALVRPPQGAPLVIAIYMDGTKHPLKVRDAAIAEIGAAIFESYQR